MALFMGRSFSFIAILCVGALLGGLAVAIRRESLIRPPGTDSATLEAQRIKAGSTWLTGSAEERLAQVERHLRGMDVTMAEIGYRYGELIVAAKERNWEYAQYQTEKIDLSLRLALERRPKRSSSAQPFLTDDLPRVRQAIAARRGAQLDSAVESLHRACNSCHVTNAVPHFQVVVDRIRDRAR
jgi:hypothetical protein